MAKTFLARINGPRHEIALQIFMVIVLDAFFSILFERLGI